MSLVCKLIILMKFWGPLGLESNSFLVLGSLLKHHQHPFSDMGMYSVIWKQVLFKIIYIDGICCELFLLSLQIMIRKLVF